MTLKSVDLFAGAGGLALGVSQAGFRHLALLELDAWACATLSRNFGIATHPCDIRSFDYASIGTPVDFLTGGPPCQPFSLGGKHSAYLDERNMFPEAYRAIRELRPKIFLIENVKGLGRPTFANHFEHIRLQLRHPEILIGPGEEWEHHLARLQQYETAGKSGSLLTYNVIHQFLDAADYGISQRRERVFFLGFREDLKIEWSFPEATHAADALLWDQWRSGEYWDEHKVSAKERKQFKIGQKRALNLDSRPTQARWQTVRDAIADLPDPERFPRRSRAFDSHQFIDGAKIYKGHTGSAMDLPAKALKAGVHGVPGGENMLVRRDGTVRYFSVRECARLQGFPDDYAFQGAWGQVMRQLGNAVATPIARKIADSLKSALIARSGDSASPPATRKRVR